MWLLKRESGGLALRGAEDLQRSPAAPTESNLSPAGKSGRGQETGGKWTLLGPMNGIGDVL